MMVILDLTWSQLFRFIQHIPVALWKLLLPSLSSYTKCLSGKRWSLLSDSTYITIKANRKGAESIPLKAKLQNINKQHKNKIKFSIYNWRLEGYAAQYLQSDS